MNLSLRTHIVTLLSLFGLTNLLLAQADTLPKPTVLWHEVAAHTPTLVAVPDDFDPAEPHTLVIGLHGYGGTAASFQNLSTPFTDAGFIFATPEAPYGYLRGDGTLGYEWFLYDISSYIMLERPASKMELAAMRTTAEKQMGQVMRDLKANYTIDKIYVAGFSQGGIIAYLTGIHHHELVDGIIIFSSVVDPDWLGNDDIKEGAGVRALIIQGKQDKLVPIELAENGRDLLINNGYDVTYKTFEGKHTIPKELHSFVIDWIRNE